MNHRFFVTFFVFLFFMWFFWLVEANTEKFVFITEPQKIELGEVSDAITIQSQDSNGNVAAVLQTVCIALSSNSQTGQFSSSATNWSPVSIITMNKNTANRTFYYKNENNGTYLVYAKVALRPEEENRTCASWPQEEWGNKWNISQNIIIGNKNEDVAENITNNTQFKEENSTTAESQISPKFFITAYAGKDHTALSGASVFFDGYAEGLSMDISSKARFLWNFGDGNYFEGKNVSHVFWYPGTYVVTLETSFADMSASHHILLTVLENPMHISEIKPNKYIEFENKSSAIIDVSGFGISNGVDQPFYFSKNSLVAPRAFLVLTKEILGFDIPYLGRVIMLYPNGKEMFSMAYFSNGISEKESLGFDYLTQMWNKTLATPGAQNSKIATSSEQSFATTTTTKISNKLKPEIEKKISPQLLETSIINPQIKGKSFWDKIKSFFSL